MLDRSFKTMLFYFPHSLCFHYFRHVSCAFPVWKTVFLVQCQLGKISIVNNETVRVRDVSWCIIGKFLPRNTSVLNQISPLWESIIWKGLTTCCVSTSALWNFAISASPKRNICIYEEIFLQVLKKHKKYWSTERFHHGKQHGFFRSVENAILTKCNTYHRWHLWLCKKRHLVPIC